MSWIHCPGVGVITTVGAAKAFLHGLDTGGQDMGIYVSMSMCIGACIHGFTCAVL